MYYRWEIRKLSHWESIFSLLKAWPSFSPPSWGSTPNGMECHEQGTRTLAYVEQAIETGMADGSLRTDLNPTLTSMWLWMQLVGVVQFASTRKGDHILREYGVSIDELLAESMNLGLRAIAA